MDYNLEVCHHLAHDRPIDEGIGVVLSHHCLCHEVVERGKPVFNILLSILEMIVMILELEKQSYITVSPKHEDILCTTQSNKSVSNLSSTTISVNSGLSMGLD